MTYESQNRKVDHIKQIDNKQQDQLSKQKQKNIIVDNDFKAVRARGTAYKVLRDFSRDWEVADLDYNNDNMEFAWKSYEVEFGYMDERLIPYIFVDILWTTAIQQNLEDEPKVLIPTQSVQPNNGNIVFFELEDHPTESDSSIKRVTAHVGIQFNGFGFDQVPQGEVLFKLVAQIRVPQEIS